MVKLTKENLEFGHNRYKEGIKQGYAKAQSEIEKDKFVIKCMEVSKEVGYAKALDAVGKIINFFIIDDKASITKNTHKKTKKFLRNFIKELEYIKQEIARLESKWNQTPQTTSTTTEKKWQ